MRIVCPGCSASYDVPEALLGPGSRTVRCARCSAEWTAMAAPLAAEAPLPPDEPEIDFYHNEPHPDPSDEDADFSGRTEPRLSGLRPRPSARPAALPPPEPEPRKGGALAIVAWAASVLILAGAGGAAVQWRSEVMAAWPPSERVFAAIGLR